ncbi:MAG TPA: class I SAM-dependent methyltransferase [Chitinophagales bacterium]|nr:class I SAM-dependent methyltransferase [Chitinophagales bacterium]
MKRYSAFHLVKCASCGFVFSQKIPTEQELIDLYNHYGRDDYLSPVTVKRFHQILDALEKFRQTNNLIDVGCGIGYFLEVAKERGWNVYGTEFTDDAVRICRDKGIMMHQGKLDPENYEPHSFDVVISIEVIEHINNPLEETRNFKSILRTGGCIYLTTPNFNALSRIILKEKWNVLAYPEHLCYYSPKTIRRLFKTQNFSKAKIETTGISITRMKSSMSQSHQTGIAANSEDEKLRSAIESNRALRLIKAVINRTLTFMHSGDNLKATFISK